MSPSPQRGRNRIWRNIHDAVIGTQQDFTEGSIARAVALLAVPMVLEMAMESLFGIVDVFFVARLGADAVATVGLTEGMLTIVFGVAMGLSMATTAMVARRTGEKDPRGAAVAAAHSIGIGLAISAVVGVIGVTHAPKLLSLMGASPTIIQTGSTYTSIVLGSVSIIFLLFLINGIFQCRRHARRPKPRRRKTSPGGALRLDRRFPQHALSGLGRNRVHHLRRTPDRHLHHRP